MNNPLVDGRFAGELRGIVFHLAAEFSGEPDSRAWLDIANLVTLIGIS